MIKIRNKNDYERVLQEIGLRSVQLFGLSQRTPGFEKLDGIGLMLDIQAYQKVALQWLVEGCSEEFYIFGTVLVKIVEFANGQSSTCYYNKNQGEFVEDRWYWLEIKHSRDNDVKELTKEEFELLLAEQKAKKS